MTSKKSINYKENSSSYDSDEMAIDIDHLNLIPSQTSKWNKEHVNSLNIKYINSNKLLEIINPSNINNNINYKNLILPKWNKQKFLISDNEDYKDIKIPKVITIIRKIKNVLINELSSTSRETKVDSFVMTLLDYLGFDEEPFLMHPQYDYSVKLDDNKHKISSKVEFMITKEDKYIVLIVEDKHPKNVSELSDWSEPQIAGEIFGAAYHNVSMNIKQNYPFNIYAIRIIGTKFTFYKATIERNYLIEAQKKLPTKNNLQIKRYPYQTESNEKEGRVLNALDFTIENDRKIILEILKSLYEINKE
jgi:hypothetical protein